MKLFSPSIILLVAFILASCASSYQAENANSFSAESTAKLAAYEMPRTQVAPIKDSKKNRQYELYIKLPEEYSENTDVKYPVIYTTDASVHMDMLSGSTEFLMPDVILVGISYQKDLNHERRVAASRARDFTFIEYEEVPVPTGEARNHLTFIRDDVIKYVENNYRADPAERTYFGYSAGGSFGAYILFEQPDTFNHYILGSPALDQEELEFLDALPATSQQDMNANVIVLIGELETSEMEITEKFVSLLERKSQSGLTLTGLEIIDDSNHITAFPETVIRGIKWLAKIKSE